MWRTDWYLYNSTIDPTERQFEYCMYRSVKEARKEWIEAGKPEGYHISGEPARPERPSSHSLSVASRLRGVPASPSPS